MEKQLVVHSTFVIERSFSKTPERVFHAFADPAKKLKWFGVGGKTDVEDFQMDFRVGGIERMQYRFKEDSPFPGVPLINAGSYQDIVPNQRIVTCSTMTLGDRRISASLVTIELLKTEHGTDLICTHQGSFFEGSDGPEMREQGWRSLFERLGAELDAEGKN